MREPYLMVHTNTKILLKRFGYFWIIVRNKELRWYSVAKEKL